MAEFEEKLKLVQAEIMTADEMRAWYFGKEEPISKAARISEH